MSPLRADAPTRWIFIAAFRSLSWCAPHDGQSHSRSFKSFTSGFLYPHTWHNWLDEYHLSMNTICVPNFIASYSSILKNSEKPKLCTFLPQRLAIPFMLSVSKQIHAYSSHSLRAVLKWKSLRWLSIFRYALASSLRYRSLLCEPFCLRESLRHFFRIVFMFCMKKFGEVISCPSEAVRNFFSPKSNPTLLPVRNLTCSS